MKLIYCQNCHDVVKLRDVWRTCYCGESRGVYHADGLHASINGPCVPVGFSNSSFAAALSHRPAFGLGRSFEAFVIPKRCQTIEEIKNEENISGR